MIKYLLIKRLELIWIVFHIVLGFASTFTPYFLVFWVLAIIGSSFVMLFLNRNKDGVMTYTLAYLLGVEVFSRMARAPITGMLPDEIGKYFPFFVLLMAFLLEGKVRSKGIGWWIILLTLPSVFLIDKDYLRYGLVFAYGGILVLSLMVLYFSEKKINYQTLNNIFRVIIYPLIGVLAFITVKTPDLDKVSYNLSALHETSGGYGSNQVSTILGIGILIMGYFYFTKQKLFSIKYADEFLLGYFLFRGLLTFSRGGMMVPVFALIIFYLILRNYKNLIIQGQRLRKLKFSSILFIAVGLVAVFIVVNSITKGQLALRYQGETAGTLKGVKENDLNHITSNRLAIGEMDLLLFLDHPFLGVGPGMSKYAKGGHYGFGSHLEFTRLPAEHGIFGAIVVVLLIVVPINRYRRIRNPMHKALFALFILVAILTSFHAAMRTMVTPFFYGLAFAQFDFEEQ